MAVFYTGLSMEHLLMSCSGPAHLPFLGNQLSKPLQPLLGVLVATLRPVSGPQQAPGMFEVSPPPLHTHSLQSCWIVAAPVRSFLSSDPPGGGLEQGVGSR